MNTNRLINEKSTYLLQHATNPVDWYPWSEEAFEKAKSENKPLLISIGYAACHWCHVMEKESFTDQFIADYMNEHFVCIKVDREERPDVDHIYMTAIQLLNGSGGWPLNCFVLPDKRPFYGGTYFRKEQWLQVLKALSDTFHNDLGKVDESANYIVSGIKDAENLIGELVTEPGKDFKFVSESVKKWESGFDSVWGGYGNSPKFPMPGSLLFLLEYAHFTKNGTIENHVKNTLSKMSMGGIYDHVGGGFARYAVDRKWTIPHFEKMLYDNGLLLSLYSKAYSLYGNPDFLKIINHTVNFLNRDLSSPDDVYYSSVDADSEGREGAFYTWSDAEINEILVEDADLFKKFYNVTKEGNWENTNILFQSVGLNEFIEENEHTFEDIPVRIKKAELKLLKHREHRIKPTLDNKIITSWNSLAVTGLCDAYKATGNNDYLHKAERITTFISKNLLFQETELLRIYPFSDRKIPAFLDDYANFIKALIHIYQITFKVGYLNLALTLTNHVITAFYDQSTGYFYYSSQKAEQPVTRSFELSDNVIPSSNSQMAFNLFYLSFYFEKEEFYEMASKMVYNLKDKIQSQGQYYANWARLAFYISKPYFEIAITGNSYRDMALKIYNQIPRNYLIAAGQNISEIPLLRHKTLLNNKTTIYICKKGLCFEPVNTVENAKKIIQQEIDTFNLYTT